MMEQTQSQGVFRNMEPDRGDYLKRCFPRTFDIYRSRTNSRGRQTQYKVDAFDRFVASQFGFLQFLMDAFYSNGKPVGFRFADIAPPRIVEDMDILMANYLVDPVTKSKHDIKELYVFALEAFVALKMDSHSHNRTNGV